MKRTPLVWMSWLAFAVSGCSDSDEARSTRKKVTLEPTIKAPVEDPTKKMAVAVNVGKSSGDIQLKYQFGSKPEVAILCPVEIALLTQDPHEDVEVEITGMEDLVLEGQLTRTLDLKSNEPALMRFTVVPERIGVFLVTVTTKIPLSADNVQEQAFAIPFIAGDLKAQAAKPLDEKASPAPSNSVSQTTEKTSSPEGK